MGEPWTMDSSLVRFWQFILNSFFFVLKMSNRNRSRDVSTDGLNKELSLESHDKRQSTFNKTADVDDPPFSRLFLLIPKAMSEDELRKAFLVHGTIQDIYIVRDRRNQESKGYLLNSLFSLIKFVVFFSQIGIAYIKYEKASAAARAMEEMNGVIIPPHIRSVKVNLFHFNFLSTHICSRR
jgi:RNA recognition motif-containing protein